MSQQSDIETFASVDGDKPAGGRVLPESDSWPVLR